MKRALLHIVSAMAVVSVLCLSCQKKGGIIPRATLSKIYAELFVADSWLSMASSEEKYMADTMAFYAPIFKKYGFTTEDYLHSVEYYLNDPKRFSRIMHKTHALLEADIKGFQNELDTEIRNRISKSGRSVMNYNSIFDDLHFTDRLNLQKDDKGIYVPVEVKADTVFEGPRIIVFADSLHTMPEPPKSLAIAGRL